MKFFLLMCCIFAFSYAAVDINTAGIAELTSLKNIGKKKAELILKYRKAHGCFESIEALVNVKSIGMKTVAINKKELQVSACKK